MSSSPVKYLPKVYSLDHHRAPFMMLDATNLLEQVLDVSMPPIPALDCRNGSNVWLFSIWLFLVDLSIYLLPAPKA